FEILGSGLAVLSDPGAGTYHVCVAASGSYSNSPYGTAFVITAIAAGTCPDNDGSSGASAGSPQSPSLLAGYAATINGTHGLGCKVAGVDYHVGLPVGTTLVVPTSGNIPAGTSISGNIVTVNANNVTFQGFDMTGKSIQDDGISGLTIQY